MKKYLLILIFCYNVSLAQTTISYFPWQNMLGVTYSYQNFAALDYKIETNSFFNNLNMELGIRRSKTFIRRIDHTEYLEVQTKFIVNYGLGLAFSPLQAIGNVDVVNGYYIDFGARWPIQYKRNTFFLILDCNPYINKDFTNGNLRTRLGLGYLLY